MIYPLNPTNYRYGENTSVEAYEGKISQRGQITIPATLRARFGLTP